MLSAKFWALVAVMTLLHVHVSLSLTEVQVSEINEALNARRKNVETSRLELEATLEHIRNALNRVQQEEVMAKIYGSPEAVIADASSPRLQVKAAELVLKINNESRVISAEELKIEIDRKHNKRMQVLMSVLGINNTNKSFESSLQGAAAYAALLRREMKLVFQNYLNGTTFWTRSKTDWMQWASMQRNELRNTNSRFNTIRSRIQEYRRYLDRISPHPGFERSFALEKSLRNAALMAYENEINKTEGLSSEDTATFPFIFFDTDDSDETDGIINARSCENFQTRTASNEHDQNILESCNSSKLRDVIFPHIVEGISRTFAARTVLNRRAFHFLDRDGFEEGIDESGIPADYRLLNFLDFLFAMIPPFEKRFMNLNGADNSTESELLFIDMIFANAPMMPLPAEIRVVPAAEFPHDLQYVQNTFNTGPMNPSHVIIDFTKNTGWELEDWGFAVLGRSQVVAGTKLSWHVHDSGRILQVFERTEKSIDPRRGTEGHAGKQYLPLSGATRGPEAGKTSSRGHQEHRYSGQVLGNAHGRVMPCGWYQDPSEGALDKYVGVLCPVEMWDEPPNEFWNDAAVSAVGGKMWEAYESIYVDEAGDGEAQAKWRRWLE